MAGAAGSPVVARPVAVRSVLIVRPEREVIPAVVRPVVGVCRAALRRGSRVGKVPPLSCNLVNRWGMPRVSPVARIRPGTSSLGGRPVTPLTAKTGRITAGNGKIAGSRQPVTGKKTGKIMPITHAKIGKNTGTTTITAAVTMAAVTMEEDTRRGEY